MPYRSPEEQKRYQRVWIQQRRAKWFEGKICQECGEQDYTLLAVTSTIGKRLPKSLWSRSEAKREEILGEHGAVVLCRRCETLKTHRGIMPPYHKHPHLRPGKRRRHAVPDFVPAHLKWEWLRWTDLGCPMPVHDPSLTQTFHFPLKHSEETKRKIAEGVKQARANEKVIHVDFIAKVAS